MVPIVTVDSEDEAIALANDSDFGLGASVWTMNRAKGERMARRLESGMVWINDHMFSHGACSCSWGGEKQSGLGRSHSKFGLYECVNIKLVTWEPSRTRNFWWHPYDEALGRAMRASAKLLYGRDADKPARCETASCRSPGWGERPCATCSAAKAQPRANCRCKAPPLSRSLARMTGALTHAASEMRQSELQRTANERRRNGQKKRPRRWRPLLPRLHRPRHALVA